MTAISRIIERIRELEPRRRLHLLIGSAVVIALALLYSLAAGELRRLERRLASREADAAELLLLKQRHREATAAAGRNANLLAAVRPADTPAALIEEIGIRGSGLRITPLKPEQQSGVVEESAEARIDRLTLNELVNLLYRLEQRGRTVTVQRGQFKVRFDDPSRLDAILAVTLKKPAPQR